MKRKLMYIRILVIAAVLVSVGVVGLALAQEPADENTPSHGQVGSSAYDPPPTNAVIPIQGRLLDSSGNPINGTRTVVFSIYEGPVGGTAVCSDTQDVNAVNGLFSAYMDTCQGADLNGWAMWLGIKVGSDAEMTPRQPLYPVTSAWNLRPGAYIEEASEEFGIGLQIRTWGEGSTALSLNGSGQYNKGLSVLAGGEVGSTAVKAEASGSYSCAGDFRNTGSGIGIWVRNEANWNPALKAEASGAKGIAIQALAVSSEAATIVQNTGSGMGAHVTSAGAGLSGPALRAEAKNAGGIAVRAVVTSTDASVAIENMGTGALLKAFGGDSGDDEFRINNNGSIESKADSYVFAPGTEATLNATSSGVSLLYYGMGNLKVDPSTTGDKMIQFGITLPGVLYGQPVKVEEVTIYYQTSNSASYIDRTRVLRIKSDAYSFYSLVSDDTNRTSTAWTSYSVTPTADNLLSASEGFVAVELTLHFAGASEFINIGGVRVRLGHHDLY